MRNLNIHNACRVRDRGFVGDETCGAFIFPSKIDGQDLRVIASSDCGWDHVSISRTNRCPNWPEMEYIRRLFFRDDEAVMQYHAPIADYVDGSKFGHPYCLHLWRPHAAPLPTPPKWMVGGMSPAEAHRMMLEDSDAQ